MPLNLSSIELNIESTDLGCQMLISRAQCVRKPCICCLISVVGIVTTECQTLPCATPFGRCSLSNMSALAIKQLSCELYLYVKEHLIQKERRSRALHLCVEYEYCTML